MNPSKDALLFGLAASLWLALPAAVVHGQETTAGRNGARDSARPEEITVTGTAGAYVTGTIGLGGKDAVSILEVPNSVSVITRQRMDDQNLITVEDALRETTGVNVTTWDGLVGQVRARGYTLDVAYDGIPTYSGSAGVQEYDLAVYDRLEVLRGPAGLFKGSGQPSGTANFVRKRGLATLQTSVVASAGSWANRRAEIDVGGPLMRAGRLRSRLVATTQNREFHVDGAEQRKSVAYGALDFDITPDTLASIMVTWQDDLGKATSSGLPAYTDGRFIDAPRTTTVSAPWNRYTYETLEYAGELRHRFDNAWQVRLRAGFREQDKTYSDAFPSPNVGVDPATGLIASYNRRSNIGTFERNGVDLYASGPFQLFGREHSALLGYGAELYEVRNRSVNAPTFPNVPFGEPNVVPEPDWVYTAGSQSKVEQDGLYAQARLSVSDPLSVVIGGRVSNFETRSRSIPPGAPTEFARGAHADDEVTPYAGLVHHLRPNVTAYASYSDIFIPQTAETANGDVLDPRVGVQLEIGVKGSFAGGALAATAAAFRTHDENRALPDIDHPGFFVQAGEVEVTGVDLEVGGSPRPGLDLTVGYTWLKTEYTVHQSLAGQAFSIFEPEHALKVFAKFTPQTGRWSRLWIAGGLNANSTIVGGGVADLREQEPYAVLSLHGGYAVSDSVSVTLTVNNLLDEKYYVRVGGLNTYNTYGDPLNALFSLRARL